MGSVVPLLLRPSAFELPGPFGEHLEQDFNFWELLGNFWEPAFELPGAFGEHLEQDFNFWELLGNFWDSKAAPCEQRLPKSSQKLKINFGRGCQKRF